MMICFSKSGQGYSGGEVLRKAYSNFVESRSLSSMTGPALQHSESNAVGHKSKPSVARGVAVQSDGITDERTWSSNSPGGVSQFSRNALCQRNGGYTPWLCAVDLAMFPSGELVLKDKRRDLCGFSTEKGLRK